MGICGYSATRALLRLDTDVRRGDLGCSLRLKSLLKSLGLTFCRGLPHHSWQTISLWISLCSEGHCHAGTDLGHLVMSQHAKSSWTIVHIRRAYRCADQVYNILLVM